jgi:hypothetical protein
VVGRYQNFTWENKGTNGRLQVGQWEMVGPERAGPKFEEYNSSSLEAAGSSQMTVLFCYSVSHPR